MRKIFFWKSKSLIFVFLNTPSFSINIDNKVIDFRKFSQCIAKLEFKYWVFGLLNLFCLFLCYSTSLSKCRSNENDVSFAFSKVIFNFFFFLSVLFLLPLMLNVPKQLKNVKCIALDTYIANYYYALLLHVLWILGRNLIWILRILYRY